MSGYARFLGILLWCTLHLEKMYTWEYMAKPKKNKPARSKSEEEADRRNIAALYLRGDTQMEIAAKLRVSQATVSRDLVVIQEQWKIERVQDINEAKQRELSRVDNLEREYWQAWEASKAKQVSDPRYLAGVMSCIDKRCAILGIEAPKRTDLTTNGKELGADADVRTEILRKLDSISTARPTSPLSGKSN